MITVLFFFSNFFYDYSINAQNPFTEINVRQNPYLYKCVQTCDPSIKQQISNNGYLKPSVTDVNTPQDAYFPVLIVFVQFVNDPGPDVSWWPRGGAPLYLNQLLASQKKYPVNGNWWDTYSEENEIISDFWLEQSRGHFHVVGKTVSIVLDHDYFYYQTNGLVNKVNDDIYAKLKNIGIIDWSQFDKWTVTVTDGVAETKYQPDGYVDMIYKIHRSHAPLISLPAGGISALGESYTQGMNYLIDPVNHIYINGDYYYQGSGITMSPGFGGNEYGLDYFPYAPLTKTGVASFSEHEHGHYLFGPGHTNYGKMSGGNSPFGVDECLSPWEKISIGYMIPKVVNYSFYNYEIGDFSSRNLNDTGEVLQVPVSILNDDEFFLIAIRNKVSNYDKIMWGDTAHGNPYRSINPQYGKGIYIYHTFEGYSYSGMVDQECADGLFSWTLQGYEHPDWSDDQNVEYFTRVSVSYNNDRSLGSMQCADGKSIFTWFSLGQKHSCIGCDGTDKIFTNKSEVWTSREFQGDRWDAWNVGYNEIFSPYSSPNTKDWNNNNTGIFIWLYNSESSSSTSYFKIYRAGYGGMTEDAILAFTPPSKPMGIVSKLTDCENNYQYPVIYWTHNMEPDMTNQTVSAFDKKFYNIYKARSKNIEAAPSQYEYLTTVNIDKDSLPYFIDYSEPIQCGGNNPVEAIRYVVSAVDNSGWESVKSDFASVIANENSVFSSNFNNINPVSFELKQNYPNPFNPETEITYSIAKSGPVKMTVFDVAGKLVSLLVDDVRQKGVYSIKFNGSNFASGIYFYRLESPGFVKTRKMVLIK